MRSWRPRLVATAVALASAARVDASIVSSLALLHTTTSDTVDTTVCLAAVGASDVVVTHASCVAGRRAARWTAQLVSSDDQASRLIVENQIDVASIDTESSPGLALVRLQRNVTTSAAVDHASVVEDGSLSVLNVNLSTLEFAWRENVTRLPTAQCGIQEDSKNVYCVDVSGFSGDGDASVLFSSSTPMGLGIAPSAGSSGNTTAFTLLPTAIMVSAQPQSSSSSSSSSSSDEIQEPDTNVTTYVLTPEANSLTQAPSFMAGLRLTKDGASYCGGSLITPSVVLTAAHCMDSGTVPAFVSVGALATTGGDPSAEVLAVEIVQVHPHYDRTSKANDLALVKLREPSQAHAPIRLENARRLGTNRATVYGYGVTQQDAAELSPKLRSVELPLIASRQQCEASFGRRLDSSLFCAGGEAGRDACTGDSGGPLVVLTSKTPSLLGVVSAGDGCGVQGRPGLYTWIGSASAVAFISTHVPEATWTASVRINGVALPVVPSRDEAIEYPQFTNASGSTTSPIQGTVAPSTQVPQERDGSTTTRVPQQGDENKAPTPSTSPAILYRVEFGGEDLTTFTRASLLAFLASGSTAGASEQEAKATSQVHVRFTLVSSVRLDALVAVISRHDTLALHRRRARW